jgi:hypothetical protein
MTHEPASLRISVHVINSQITHDALPLAGSSLARSRQPEASRVMLVAFSFSPVAGHREREKSSSEQ